MNMTAFAKEFTRLMNSTHCHVVRVETDTDGDYRADITVVRLQPGQFTDQFPNALDLPADIRQALRDWLDTAEAS